MDLEFSDVRLEICSAEPGVPGRLRRLTVDARGAGPRYSRHHPSPSSRSGASVAVENPFAIVRSQGSGFGYAVRFMLRETSRASDATIERIVIYGPSGSDETGPQCWRDRLRLPAGGELDTFYTDAGAQWLSYCGPGSGGTTASPRLEAEITFSDDRGVAGSVRIPITLLR